MPKTVQTDLQLQYAYTDLRISTGIEIKGNVAATQQYDIASGTYTPDYTTEHLLLAIWADIQDPDGIITAAEMTPVNIKWTQTDGTSAATAITSATPGFTLAEDGELTLKKNSNPDHPLTLTVTFDILDSRTGQVIHCAHSLLIDSQAISQRPVITLDCPSVIRYDPIRDPAPTKTITAALRVGTTDIAPPNVRYIWHKRDHSDMTWAAVDPAELMDYDVAISADTTKATVSCEYIGSAIDLRCYALYNPYGSAASLAITDTTPYEDIAIRRAAPKLSAVIQSPGKVHPKMKAIQPTARIYDPKGEITDPDTKTVITWNTAKGTQTGAVTFSGTIATGSKPQIPLSFISKTNGGKIRVNVAGKQPLKALKTADGKIITDSQGRVLLAR